ncbi:MAG: septum formation initiator family protein [Bacteroidota bacterium]
MALLGTLVKVQYFETQCINYAKQAMAFRLLNPIRWNKSFLFLILAGFMLVWFSVLDTHSIKTRWELNNQKKILELRTQQLNESSEQLKKDIKKLENDPELLERIAREEYGMHKPGETVYKVKREK